MTEHGCPNCQASIPLAAEACPYCGIRVEDALSARAWERQVAAATPRVAPAPRRRSDRRFRLAAAVLASAAAGLAWLAVPEPGLPVPPGARASPDGDFAFVAPRGWRDADGYGRSPSAAASLTDGFAVIQVRAAPASVCPAADDARRAAALVAAEFGAEARVESEAAARIDGLPAARIAAAGPRVRMPSPNRGRVAGAFQQPAPEYESLPLRGQLVAVAGAGRCYLIKAFSSDGYLQSRRWAVEEFLADFRVTRRPAWSRLR